MADYSKLVQETDSIELRSISSYALDELLLIKRAISFFETLKRISVCLQQGVAGRSATGQMDTQQLSLYQLTSALASVDPKACADPIKFFLSNASAIKSLRAAMKGGRWGVEETAEVMIQCAGWTEKHKTRGADDASQNPNWYAGHAVEDQNAPILERLGIGLEHVGRNIRKLDYAREILGGNWRRNTSTANQSTEMMRESDFSSPQNAFESMDSYGLSNMLQGRLATRIAKTTQVGISRQELEFQYQSVPLLLSLPSLHPSLSLSSLDF
jgi:hypothetical protein